MCMWLLSNICECIWQCNNGQPAKPTKLSEPSWAESRLLCHGQHFHGHEKEAEVESWKLGVGCWVLGVRARLRRQTKKVFWVPFWQMSKTNIILRSWKIPLLSPTQLPHPIFSAKILANNCLRLSLGLDFGPLSLSCQYWWNTFGQKLDGNIKIPSHWHNALCNFTRAFAI